jgi:hypothetical protein
LAVAAVVSVAAAEHVAVAAVVPVAAAEVLVVAAVVAGNNIQIRSFL